MLHIHFITLFPESIEGMLKSSIFKRALEQGGVSYSLTHLREFALDKHKTVDDHPYGGGEGMLLKVDVLHRAWGDVVIRHCFQPEEATAELRSTLTKAHPKNKTHTIYLSPQGPVLQQEKVRGLFEKMKSKHLILICGHYEGVDERFIDLCVDEEVSIGDYILSGGEVAALVLTEALVRLVPGVLGNPLSLLEDSIERGGLKHPQYTRPQSFIGKEVPEVLMSGNHEKIQKWKINESLMVTQRKRPDLIRREVRK